jgi:hypothetical protein
VSLTGCVFLVVVVVVVLVAVLDCASVTFEWSRDRIERARDRMKETERASESRQWEQDSFCVCW